MKIFIITVAVLIVYSFTMVFAQDFRQAQRNSYRLKYVCEELSATAASFYDLEDYSEGYTIFMFFTIEKCAKFQPKTVPLNTKKLISFNPSNTPSP